MRILKLDCYVSEMKLIRVLTLNDRIYSCACGYECDRDIHAAKNVKYIGVVKRNECLEQASAETLPSGLLNVLTKLSQVKEAKTKIQPKGWN